MLPLACTFTTADITPLLGRFVQADTIVPEPGNPQSLNRYSYVENNPVRYTDPSGHCVFGLDTVVCIAAAVVALKAIDYGWTAWDTYQSGKVLADPNASRGDKLMAGLNVGMAIAFEAIEPDDLIPVSVPLDDATRKWVMKGAREAYEEGGEEALERFIRDSLGEYADDVLSNLGLSDVGRHTADQQALKEIVEEATLGGRKSLSVEDAETVLDWAEEINYPGWRAGQNNVSQPSHGRGRPGYSNEPHIHLPGTGKYGGHIPVETGVRPRIR